MAQLFRLLILASFFFSIVTAASASDKSSTSQLRCPDIADTHTSMELDSPEIEVKLLDPTGNSSSRLHEILKGSEVKLPGPDGKMITYSISRFQHNYRDTYYEREDGPEHEQSLYKKRGLLRNRTRWDRKENQTSFTYRSTSFQAKDGSHDRSSAIEGLDSSVFARNEIPGLKYTDQAAFDRVKDSLLRPDSTDVAVRYARKLLGGYTGQFVPLVEVFQERLFFKLTPVNPSSPDVPSYYVTLDSVNYTNVADRFSEMSKGIEVEIIDKKKEVAQDSTVKRKLGFLNAITRYLQETFQFQPTDLDKFETGVRSVILRQ